MTGSPLLSRRIAHIRRGPHGRTRDAFSRAAVAAGCCLISVAAAACRPDGAVTGERNPVMEYDVESSAASWPVDALIDRFPDTEVAVKQGDRRRAEGLLLQRRTDDPNGPWSARLGRFYASSIIGHHLRITDGGPLWEMTGLERDGAFAAHARGRLLESSDPVLLTAAAEYLVDAPRYNRGGFTADDLLAKDCLERAARLEPESVPIRARLARLVSRERDHAAARRSREASPADHFEALAALPAAERFEAMAAAAVDSLASVRQALGRNYRNAARYTARQIDNAGRFAREVLALAESLADTPDAGLFVYQAHMTLASLAMLEGDVDAAVDSLRNASLAPPAEGLAYGRRLAAWRVVRDLVDVGERTAVADFLEALADRNLVERDLLLASAGDVRSGQPSSRLLRRFGVRVPR